MEVWQGHKIAVLIPCHNEVVTIGKVIDVPYQSRVEGSTSKLRTFHDGFRVLWKLFSLFRGSIWYNWN